MSEILRLENVGFSFGAQEVLKNVSFTLKEHEFISVVGDSGCGKSTLLRLLAGYLKPSAGKIYFENKAYESINSKIAVSFQQPTLYPWLDLSENVSFKAKLEGVNKKERKALAEHFLKAVDLLEFSKKYPYECSGGMHARAALAQALACKSDLILMDEPFAALDAFSKQSMQDLVRVIYQKNKFSVFFITHDIDEALYLSDRVFIMKPCKNSTQSRVQDVKINFKSKDLSSLKALKEFSELKEYIYTLIKERYNYVI